MPRIKREQIQDGEKEYYDPFDVMDYWEWREARSWRAKVERDPLFSLIRPSKRTDGGRVRN